MKDPHVLKVKALDRRGCRRFVIMTVLISLIACVAGFFALIKLTEMQGRFLRSREVASVMAIFGIMAFFLSVLLSIFLTCEFIITFEEDRVCINSGKHSDFLFYSDIFQCFIVNNTDYSRIKFIKPDRSKYTFYVGLCHMLKREKQVILKDISELDPYFKGFKKNIGGKNGSNTVIYEKRDKEI